MDCRVFEVLNKFQIGLLREAQGTQLGNSKVCTADKIRSALAHTRLLSRKIQTSRGRSEVLNLEIKEALARVQELRRTSRKIRVETALVKRLPGENADGKPNEDQTATLVTDALTVTSVSNVPDSQHEDYEKLKQNTILGVTIKLAELNREREEESQDVVIGAAGREVAEEF